MYINYIQYSPSSPSFYEPYVSKVGPQTQYSLFHQLSEEPYYTVFTLLRFASLFSTSCLRGLLSNKQRKPHKRDFFTLKSGNPEQREISTSHYHKKYLPCTMPYFAPLWIFSGLLLLYDLYITTQHIHSVFCLQRLFLFLVSFSPSYFGGSSAFLSPISICCGFTPLLLLPCFVSAFLYMAALSPLFFRSFDVETSL